MLAAIFPLIGFLVIGLGLKLTPQNQTQGMFR